MMAREFTFRGVRLPEWAQESIARYVYDGCQPGSFLTACLENNLRDAVANADDDSLAALPCIVGYIYNEIPSAAWGDPGRVAEWMKSRRRASPGWTGAELMRDILPQRQRGEAQ